MDTMAALLTHIHGILTGSAALKSAMSDPVRLYLTWAPPDTEFPYLVYRIDLSAQEFFPMRQGTLYLDIWSDSPNAEEITAIRKLIVGLLDELYPSTAEITGGRLWLQTEGFVPESEQGIFHFATQWNLRYYRKAEMASIISR